MTALQPARHGRQPVRAPAKPRLRAVPPLRPSPRAGVLAFAVVGLVFAIMLGAAMLNSKLITGQQQLDKLDRAIAQAQAEHDKYRLEVAQLESPDRIVQAAQSQGMIPAAQTVWVLPVVPGDPALEQPATAPATSPPATSERATGPDSSTTDATADAQP
jgi:cell division protein FtsL